MKTYIGNKIIKAMPMTRQQYNDYRGWELPDDEDGSDDGYLVEYLYGGQSNHPKHSGYISWSPVEVFENAYKHSGEMSFSHAVELLKRGFKIGRKGWNGKGMFLFLVDGSQFEVNRAPLLGIYSEGTVIDYRPHIDMRTADGSIVPWIASQSDILEDDWEIVE